MLTPLQRSRSCWLRAATAPASSPSSNSSAARRSACGRHRASEWSDDANALNVIGVLCQSDADAVLLPDGARSAGRRVRERRTVDQAGGAGGDALPARTGAGPVALGRRRRRRQHRDRVVAPSPHLPGDRHRTRSGPGEAARPQRRLRSGCELAVVHGAAPAALDGLQSPDAIFIGGGATAAGMFDACWNALRPGGRLVVNGVTLETEASSPSGTARSAATSSGSTCNAPHPSEP